MEGLGIKKVLITGGLGNLGSWITTHFVQQGYQVYVLSNNQRPILKDLQFQFIKADISNRKELRQVLKSNSFDCIIHLASVNEGNEPGYPEFGLQINAFGTRNLAELASEMKDCYFVYFSTFQVYGQYEGFINEDTELRTRNDYGLTHLFAEKYVEQFHYTSQLQYSIIRLTNSYGCPKDADSSKWYLILNDLTKMAKEQKKIVLRSNGLAPRDFIWMGDVANILEQIVLKDPLNEVFNLSGEHTVRMIDIANAVQEAYLELYGERIPITVNADDHKKFENDLFVSSKKLKEHIPYTSQNKIKEESKNILQFLNSIEK